MGYGNFRGGGSSGESRGFGNRGGGFSGGFRQRRSFGPREMTKIKCSECGKEDEVPFKPREGTPVYCKDCYFKKKGIEPRAASTEFKKEAPKDEFAEEPSDSDEFGEDEEKEAA